MEPFLFVVQVVVPIDRDEGAVTRAPPPNKLAAVVATIGHDVTILHDDYPIASAATESP